MLAWVALVLAVPEVARAQAGWYAITSLRLTEEFDDNIFGSERRTSDFITRASPSVRIGYRSKPFTLLLASSVDAELFAENHDLEGLNRTEHGVELEWRPDHPVTFRIGGSFSKTQTPSELSPALGLELGRTDSTQLTVAPTLSYRFGPATVLETGYAYTESDSGGVSNTTHEPRVRFIRQLTRADVGTATYGFRLIESDDGSTTAHVVTLGWTRRLAATTTLALEAGPRFDGSGVDAEVNASVSHRFLRGLEAMLGYTRTSSPIVGQTGVATTQALVGRVATEPFRSFRVAGGVVISEVKSSSGDTMSHGVDVAASYRLTKWLSSVARYRFNHSTFNGTTVFHNIFSVGLEAAYTTRVDD